jgi:hypothetical protein
LPDITKTTISGLKGLTYIDKVDGGKEKTEVNDPLIITGFTDRYDMVIGMIWLLDG